jgi:hypothetical protein
MTTLFRFFTLSLLFLWSGLAFAANERVMQVIEIQHVEAQDIVPVVENLLGEGDRVQTFQQRLIIHTTPPTLEKIRDLIRQIDVPRQTLKIEVRQEERRLENALRPGEAKTEAAPAANHLGNTHSYVSQHVLVQDGGEAFIVAGEDIPYASEIAMVNGRHQGFYQQTAFKKIRTGFLVRPTLRGKTVDVEIVPFQQKPRRPGSASTINPPIIDYQKTSTRLHIPLNTWFEVSETANQREQKESRTICWSTGRDSHNSRIRLRIQIHPTKPAAQ